MMLKTAAKFMRRIVLVSLMFLCCILPAVPCAGVLTLGQKWFDPSPPLNYREYVILSAMTTDFEPGPTIRKRLENWFDREQARLIGWERQKFRWRNRFIRSAPPFYSFVSHLQNKGAVVRRIEDIKTIEGISLKKLYYRITDRGVAFFSDAQSLYGPLNIFDTL